MKPSCGRRIKEDSRMKPLLAILLLSMNSAYAQRQNRPKCPYNEKAARENGAPVRGGGYGGADVPLPTEQPKQSESTPCDQGGSSTKPRRTGNTAPVGIKVEVADQNFKHDTDLENWLNQKSSGGQRLLSIIPFGDARSVFVFETAKAGTGSRYTVNLLKEEYEQVDGELEKRI